MPDQRRPVTGDEMLAVADANYERTAKPRRHDHLRPIAKHHREAICSTKLSKRRLYGLDQRRVPIRRRGRFSGWAPRVQLRRHKLRDDFRIRRALTVISPIGKLLLQLTKILNDAIVDERDYIIAA